MADAKSQKRENEFKGITREHFMFRFESRNSGSFFPSAEKDEAQKIIIKD